MVQYHNWNNFCLDIQCTYFIIKLRTMKKLFFIFFSAVITAGVLQAQQPEVVTGNKPGWRKIGDSKVDFKSDKDQFLIIGADRFKSVQVKVFDAPVHIEKMEIEYDGGTKEEVALASDLKPGSESNVIELKNNSAELKKVTFVYRTVPNTTGDKAKLELWGLK